MKLNELSPSVGSQRSKRRVGRGIGSGKGKTSGRGHKGQKSRSGVSIKGFEGGQMPFYRRLPKRGFTNIFRNKREIVNVGRIQKFVDEGKLDPKGIIGNSALKECGLIRGQSFNTRLLAKGNLKTAIQVSVNGASKAAIEAVEQAGGKVTIISPSGNDKKLSIKNSENKESEVGEGGNPPEPASV